MAEALNLWPEKQRVWSRLCFHLFFLTFVPTCMSLRRLNRNLHPYALTLWRVSVTENKELSWLYKFIRIFWNMCVNVTNMSNMYFYLLCTMVLLKGKGILHGNALVVMSLYVMFHMITINSFKIICFWVLPNNKHDTNDVLCLSKKKKPNSTFYEGIINNVQQNKGIYK